MQPRWTRGAKDGVGTAYSTASKIWFTMVDGCLTEVYYPTVDSPQIRDLQFLITDGKTFFHEERRDLEAQLTALPDAALGVKAITSDPAGRYRFVKEIICDPHQNTLLMNVMLEGEDERFLKTLRVYVLCAPHLCVGGWHNNAEVIRTSGQDLLLAHRENTFCVMGASVPFKAASVGYVGTSDGWQDLAEDLSLDWRFDHALDGNVSMIGELDLAATRNISVAIGFGDSQHNAVSTLIQSLSIPFDRMRNTFVNQWKRTSKRLMGSDPNHVHSAEFFARSINLILAHEDKTYPGAMIASLSIPWGEVKGDEELGGYHLVWCRDLYQAASALLSVGDKGTPVRTLIYLAISQRENGGFSQNFWIDGRPYWTGVQLDEVAFPIMLAWRLWDAGALENFDPFPMVKTGTAFLMREGPITAQERWEEASGYSPSTLASNITALICGASFFRSRGDEASAEFIEDYADFLESHIDDWTVTTQGNMVPGITRHFIRVTPVGMDDEGNQLEDPNSGDIVLNNKAPGEQYKFPARDIIDAGFLEFVRYGVRAADSQLMQDSLKVVDALLKVETPKGPCWRRYNNDGYGQKADGSGYDGCGVGRAWPLLTGERGHYEVAAGRSAKQHVQAMENFSTGIGLIPEQIWDTKDSPNKFLTLGASTGAAVPLLWAHAEYIKLVQSEAMGKPFDRFEPVYQRYVVNRRSRPLEIWNFKRKPREIVAGVPLRIIAGAPFELRWSDDGWATAKTALSISTALELFYVDLVTTNKQSLPLTFTFYWPESDSWEGKDYVVRLRASAAAKAR